ncbi:MAG: PAS domain S-box protein [Bacteroidota bacterium]
MKKLDTQILDALKRCSKDEASYSKLEEMYTELFERYETVTKQLFLLEQAIKHDYDSILVTELDLAKPGPRIVYVNDGFTKMTGYTKEEVIGKTPRILQGERTDRHVLERLKKRLIEGQAFFGHTVNYKKDGSEFINQWDIHPLTNEKGEITHWVSYQRDISDRNASENVYFDANLEFESLTEESKRIFIDLDVQGNIMSSNKLFRELLGYEVDDLKGIHFWDLINENDQSEARILFEEFNPEVFSDAIKYKWAFNTFDGKSVVLEADVRWFVNDDETIIRIHFDNVSMRSRVMESLKIKTEDLTALLNKRDEFTLKFEKVEDGSFFPKYISDGFELITGLDPSQVLESGLQDVISSSDLKQVNDAIKMAFEGKRSTVNCSYNTHGGEQVHVIQSFKPIWNSSNTEVNGVKSVAMIELEMER